MTQKQNSQQKKVLLSAVQPTNALTLGNYLGAIRNWSDLQKTGQYDCIFFAVDLHSITSKFDPKELREQTYFAIATYLACGISPESSTLFVQSHVPEHTELAWVLTAFSAMGELSRMTQFKDKTSKLGERIPTGIFMYPVLMAADILLYQTDLVPVGADQKQHIELTRDLAERVNTFVGKPFFKLPDVYIPKVGARIMSLQDPTSKMSKSDSDPHASIFLTDSDDVILKKLKRAVTDSGTEITDDESKPGVRNLLHIQSAILGKPVAEIVQTYVGKQYGHLKVGTAEIVTDCMKPIREKTQELLKDRGELDRILKVGAERARERAARTLQDLYGRLGFLPRL